MESLWQDVSYAVRALLRRPGFSAVAVTTVALGIGANTAVFSVVNGLLLRPLPYPDAARVVALWSTHSKRGWRRAGTSVQNFLDWKAGSGSFASMAIYYPKSGNLSGGQEPRNVSYALVTPEFLEVLAIPPVRGRNFAPEENRPGRDAVAVISHELWQSALGGRSDAVGLQLDLDGRRLEVIGIMPVGFSFPAGTQLWKPFGMGPDDGGDRGAFWVYAIGRVKPDSTISSAQDELDSIAASLQQEYPDSNDSIGVFVEPLQSATVHPVRSALLLLWASVGLVLLIACVNVTHLLLARSAARRRELGIRAALGAGRPRLIRQTLTESLVLAFFGGLVGLLIGYWGVQFMLRLGGTSLPRGSEVLLDLRVLSMTAGLTLFSGLLFGTIPALRSLSSDLADRLREAGRRSHHERGSRMGRLLAATQFALALLLLIGAALLMMSFYSLLRVEGGYDPDHVLTLRVEPPLQVSEAGLTMEEYFKKYRLERRRITAFYERLLGRLEFEPGVHSVGAVNRLPLAGNWWGTEFAIEGEPISSAADMKPAFARVVVPGYFSTMQIPLLRGRSLQADDDDTSSNVVVISSSLAAAYFAGEDPLGKRLTLFFPAREEFMYTIVGVVGDIRQGSLEAPAAPILYTNLAQSTFGFFGNWGMDLVLKTQADPLSLAGPVRETIRTIDPNLPVFNIQTMEEVTGNSRAQRRFLMILLTAFGVLALLLAAVGIYGVIACSVQQRTQEIGIRLALGARRSTVLGMILGQGLLTALAGTGAGMAGALLMAGNIESLLFETSPREPLVYLAAPVVLLLIAGCACLIPARRAAGIDPAESLRSE